MSCMPSEPTAAAVIVVEDNPDNLFIMLDLLQAEVGVDACIGQTSGPALRSLLASQPALAVDLILLDLHLPHEDGYAVLRQMRAMPHLQGTKVVAVTASVMPQDVDCARMAGFDGFIGKPLSVTRFPDQIRRILDGEAVWEAR